MNYLAHLFLADDTAESLIGNLGGDFVKGPIGDRFEPAVARGILEHRRIDTFTDGHPAVAAFRRVLTPDHGHYARVIADVFFDHFLSRNWTDYSTETFDEFLGRVFSKLDTRVDAMPERLRASYPRMRDGEWFRSYATLEGMSTALYYLSRRFSRRPRLEGATRFLVDRRTDLEQQFHLFFPDVIAYAKGLRSS